MLTLLALFLFAAFILASVAFLAAASPAEASPRSFRHSASAHQNVAVHRQAHPRRAHSRHHRGVSSFRRGGSEAATGQYGGLASLFGGGSSLLSAARAHLGKTAAQLGLPASLWCADFMNLVMRQAGHPPTGSRAAKSFLNVGSPSACQPDAIAVMSRGRGGHVGVVQDCNGGNPIVVSGNHNRRVDVGEYDARRIIAYRRI